MRRDQIAAVVLNEMGVQFAGFAVDMDIHVRISDLDKFLHNNCLPT